MINRVLIRLKVVQLLYSHLITDTAFSIASPSENPTREQRFAYKVYLETLALMVRISRNIKRRDGSLPLSETPFIEGVSSDERVRALLGLNDPGVYPLSTIQSALTDEIRDSALYKRFLKEEDEGERQRIWEEIYNNIILPSEGYNTAVSRIEGYTLHAFERLRELMGSTFSNFYATGGGLDSALNQLRRSLRQSRELYIRLLSLPVALTRLRMMQLDENRRKYLATSEDLNPNLRFVDNKLVAVLQNDTVLESAEKEFGCAWLPEDRDLVGRLLKVVLESSVYQKYMEEERKPDLHRDAELWRDLFKQVIFRNEAFLESLEDKSVFWNDDFDIIGEFLLKTLKRIGEKKETGEGIESSIMPMYKDKEDEKFGEELFRYAVRNRLEYREMINESTKGSNWDSSRLAYMDVVILYCALAEILNFPKIPLKVSINEYVEIAKYYSTPRSSDFVYAQLRSICDRLIEKGQLRK